MSNKPELCINLEDLTKGRMSTIFPDIEEYIKNKYGELSQTEYEQLAWTFKFHSDTYHLFHQKTEAPQNDI